MARGQPPEPAFKIAAMPEIAVTENSQAGGRNYQVGTPRQ